jgi:rhodanese-related sulfurtransferase
MKFFCLYLFFSCNLTLLAFGQSVGVEEFEKGLKTDSVQVLDVRTAAEYQTGHIRGALLADWTNMSQFTERVQYIDRDRPVYIYCLSGGRSAAAAKWLRQRGYVNVIELDGGFNAWKRNGKQVEGLSTEKQLTPEEYLASIPVDRTVLVDFGASWCPPCVKMEPVLKELKHDTSVNFQLIKIDASVHTKLMQHLGIEPIPVFIVYRNGKETWRHTGVVTKEELRIALQ